MIKIEKIDVQGFPTAVRGMRNPMDSWDKSDSSYQQIIIDGNFEGVEFVIGENDLALAKKLIAAGSDHRKFMRMIMVWADITAPLYWWKEYDTYKVGTVANSCSTMHKIHAKELTLNDFSCEKLLSAEPIPTTCISSLSFLKDQIKVLNIWRELYVATKDKKYWENMIQLLPTSYNQLRTVVLNYETLFNMYHARKNHKLDEWRAFCAWVETLPYSEFITGVK